MASRIRLGFVGGGNMGQIAHIRNYARLTDQCELVALAELRPKLAQRVADRYRIAEVYPDHKTLLAEAEVDAVVAIMNYGLHHTVVPDILTAGKHLLTEKPMGCRASAAREWKKLADERNLVYLVGYMKRWDLGARYARDLIAEWKASGQYGAFTYLRCNMSGMDWTWNPEGAMGSGESPADFAKGAGPEPFPDWMTKQEAGYYNMNINFFVHQVNLFRFLLGEGFRLTHTHPDGRALWATTDSGRAITLEMQTSQIPQTWDEIYTIAFEKADVEMRFPAPLRMQHNAEVIVRRTVGNSYETVRANVAPPSWSFFEQAKGYLECVRNGKTPYDSTGDAIRDLEFFEDQVRLAKAAGGKM